VRAEASPGRGRERRGSKSGCQRPKAGGPASRTNAGVARAVTVRPPGVFGRSARAIPVMQWSSLRCLVSERSAGPQRRWTVAQSVPGGTAPSRCRPVRFPEVVLERDQVTTLAGGPAAHSFNASRPRPGRGRRVERRHDGVRTAPARADAVGQRAAPAERTRGIGGETACPCQRIAYLSAALSSESRPAGRARVAAGPGRPGDRPQRLPRPLSAARLC
jgi:hypothetical protein